MSNVASQGIAGQLMPVLTHTEIISTVGAVIIAASANPRERGMGQLSLGEVDRWGCNWAGHSEYSGATALQRGGPRGF
jgi:hypothetical protein